MERSRRIGALVLSMVLLLAVCPVAHAQEEDHILVLDGGAAALDGAAVPEYDYVWHADPSQDHGEVKNSPAEYHTGTEPTGEDAVYIAHDIYYYPQLEESKFFQTNYDGETEWVYLYEAEGYENYIFSTLPVLRSGFPSQMMHTEEEAYENPVLYITQPGTYRLQGTWRGQIRVDLGEDSFTDPEARVTLILDGVDVECTVAPGLVFAQVYECDNTWEDREDYSQYVDTTDSGANVVIADGTENRICGTNIYRILRTKYKDEDAQDAYPAQKKQLKVDGAFYSYMSMNISAEAEGTGVLTVESGFEGLDSELHLTVNGGDIRILADNDGINVNEDGVSVLTVNGGSLWIQGGMGDEGDGIDSNGFILVNGGTVIASANPAADSGMDSDCGSFVQGGTVVALGSTMDWAESDADTDTQPVMNLRFSGSRSAQEEITVTDQEGSTLFSITPVFEGRTYTGMILSAPELERGGEYSLFIGGAEQCWSGDAVGGFDMGGQRPDGMEPGQRGQMPEGQQPGGNGQMPEGQQPGADGQGLPEGMEPGQTPPDGQLPEDMDPGEIPEGQLPEGQMTDGQMPDGQIPEGMGPGERPDAPEGMERPEEGGMDRGGRGGAQDWGGATCTYERTFRLSDAVNSFSSVADYRHDLTEQEEGDGYVCTSCGAVFADPEGTVLLEEEETGRAGIWIAVAVGAAVLIAIAVVIIILHKKKKA